MFNLRVLVVAAQQHDLRGRADLEREEQRHHLERVAAAVDVIAQEDVPARRRVLAGRQARAAAATARPGWVMTSATRLMYSTSPVYGFGLPYEAK